MDEHDQYMEIALQEARESYSCGGIPVGAVMVEAGNIVGRGHNRRGAGQKPGFPR